MKTKLHFQTTINCPKEILWQQISVKQLYGHWINELYPDAEIQGNWLEESEEIKFISPELGHGTSCSIKELISCQLLTFEYHSWFKDSVVDAVESKLWKGTTESYTITGQGDTCILSVDLATDEYWETLFQRVIPISLSKIKEQCESVFLGLKFPVGDFISSGKFDPASRKERIKSISELPGKIKEISKHLNEFDLLKVYRPNGWTIAQVIHHLADSHMNSLMRFKLALTEDNPQIKPYQEGLWAELVDGKTVEILSSVQLLSAIHDKWTSILENMTEEDFQKTFFHPESRETVTLDKALEVYQWHGSHHLHHIHQALSYKFN